MIKLNAGADFQVLLVNESTITGGAERRADYGHLLTTWAPVFSPSEVIPVVAEHHSKDPHLRLVVTVQQHRYASNIEHIYRINMANIKILHISVERRCPRGRGFAGTYSRSHGGI